MRMWLMLNTFGLKCVFYFGLIIAQYTLTAGQFLQVSSLPQSNTHIDKGIVKVICLFFSFQTQFDTVSLSSNFISRKKSNQRLLFFFFFFKSV